MLTRVLLAACVLAVLAGCNIVTIDEYPCPSGGTALTYDNFGRVFMASYCNTCHSAPDGQRAGAPNDYVFDTQAEIIAHKDRIFARAADTNDSMPPGPNMPSRRSSARTWRSGWPAGRPDPCS